MKKGDIVICINNSSFAGTLELDKEYEVASVEPNFENVQIKIPSVFGGTQVLWFSQKRFRPKGKEDIKRLTLKDCFIGKIVTAHWSEPEIVHITGLSRNPIGEVVVKVRRPDSERDVGIHPANLSEIE